MRHHHHDDCVFCKKIAAGDYDTSFYHFGEMVAVQFVPLNPVTEGHRLYVPVSHIETVFDDAALAGLVASFAVAHTRDFYRVRDANLIVNAGPLAGQTVRHVHWHVVPRREDDGLRLPWTPDPLAYPEVAEPPTREHLVRLASDFGARIGQLAKDIKVREGGVEILPAGVQR